MAKNASVTSAKRKVSTATPKRVAKAKPKKAKLFPWPELKYEERKKLLKKLVPGQYEALDHEVVNASDQQRTGNRRARIRRRQLEDSFDEEDEDWDDDW